MGDARITIAECLSGSTTTIGEVLFPAPTRPLWRSLTPWATVPLLAIAAWFLRFDPPPPEKPISRFQIPLAEDEVLNHYFRQGVALSPDGNDLAFVSGQRRQSKEDLSTVWRQFWGHRTRKVSFWSLDQGTVTPLADATKSAHPFFSPDGKWLGVYSNRKLKKLPLEGGPSTTICDCPGSPYGVSWGSDDTIVFNCGGEGLSRVSASGADTEQITELDKEAGEVSHRLPHVLPGGEAVLFTVVRHRMIPVDWSEAQIAVQELGTGKSNILIEGGSDGRYVPTGHLVFAREGTLMAAPFDLASLALTGPAVPVLEGVSHSIHTANAERETGTAQFAFSDSGSLAYIGGLVFPEQKRQVVWVDRDGNVEPTGIEPGAYAVVRLSPDGSKVLLSRAHTSFDIWTYDLTRKTRPRQTFEGSNDYPIWTPDGTRFTFKSDRLGSETLFRKSVDRDSAAERLIPARQNQAAQEESLYTHPGSWSPDGTKLAYVQTSPDTGPDIWILSMGDSRSAEPFLQTPFLESAPDFSPDGRWLAYVSDESGRAEVYVQPFPGPGKKVLISTQGGRAPAWAGSGRELFYRSGAASMMAVEIKVDSSDLRPEDPVVLFEGSYLPYYPMRSYDVDPNGQRFLMITLPLDEMQVLVDQYFGRSLNIVLNWFEELKRLVPTN